MQRLKRLTKQGKAAAPFRGREDQDRRQEENVGPWQASMPSAAASPSSAIGKDRRSSAGLDDSGKVRPFVTQAPRGAASSLLICARSGGIIHAMTERDPKAIAKHCRKAAERTDLPEAHREMLAGYARFYQALVEQVEDEADQRPRGTDQGAKRPRS